MYFGTSPYDLEGHIKYHGDGINLFREETFSQPRALRDGDILSNGWQVDGEPGEGFNGSVVINFNNGLRRFVPARLPLRLASEFGGTLPIHLRVGQIFETGCVVLEEPSEVGAAQHHEGQNEVSIRITGGRDGHSVSVPADLEIAVSHQEYPADITNPLGAFAMKNALGMNDAARVNLPAIFDL